MANQVDRIADRINFVILFCSLHVTHTHTHILNCTHTHTHTLKRVHTHTHTHSRTHTRTSTGEAFAWGMGTNHQLGTGEEDDSWTPVKITGKKIENCRILDASAGGQHTALLVSNEESVD